MGKFLLFALVIIILSSVIPVYAMDGKAVYDKVCFVCHKTGISGSPKLGDKDAWKSRITQGKKTLYEHSIMGYKGKTGFMPAKGGRQDLSDDEVKAAVDYIVDHSK